MYLNVSFRCSHDDPACSSTNTSNAVIERSQNCPETLLQTCTCHGAVAVVVITVVVIGGDVVIVVVVDSHDCAAHLCF